LQPEATLLEVYCGVGLFSAFLAGRVKRLVGIEASESAGDDFAVNLDEFDHVELYQGTAEQILPGLELHPDMILVDPPRSGIERNALQALLDMQAPCLAYISCDPATLARDARRLVEGGYTLKQITLFDLFPQTYHIESISVWER
jgi:23S rRNA (uracil1939-C5)-methyltransferase